MGPSTQRLRIIVTGLIGQHSLLGGVAWDYVQYPAALLRMGHDVYYVEDSGEWPYNIDGGPTGKDLIARDATPTLRHLETVLSRFGLSGRWAYRFPLESRWYGMPDTQRDEILQSTDLLINVSGTLERPEEYRSVTTLAYLDSDPVFTQIKLMADGFENFKKRVPAHDIHFSFGECLPGDWQVGRTWLPTRQPILLDEWKPSDVARDVYTTVMSWTSYAPVQYAGSTYGQKDIEFERFLDLPGLVRPARLEVAVGGLRHAKWRQAKSRVPATASSTDFMEKPDVLVGPLLQELGWSVANPLNLCGDVDSYRDYIQSSKGEWSVAKNGYIRGRSGWFSCRSACYMAAGRPVIVQDTGFSQVIPTGRGVLAFDTLDDAAAAIKEVEAEYVKHARAAREIAEAYFDSEKVLSHLIDRAMNRGPVPSRTPAAIEVTE
jgi:hypothetical protein